MASDGALFPFSCPICGLPVASSANAFGTKVNETLANSLAHALLFAFGRCEEIALWGRRWERPMSADEQKEEHAEARMSNSRGSPDGRQT